jgi:hypothetical protein
MTSILQVLHVVVKKPFKDYLKEQYNTWLLENDLQYTRTCKLKKPSLNSLSLDTTRLAKNNSEFYYKRFQKVFQMHSMGQRITIYGNVMNRNQRRDPAIQEGLTYKKAIQKILVPVGSTST